MKKLQEMQAAVAESKKQLDHVKVTGFADDQKIKVESNGNRRITSLNIEKELSEYDKEELEELLIIAINRAIEQADHVNEQEMAKSAGQFMPR